MLCTAVRTLPVLNTSKTISPILLPQIELLMKRWGHISIRWCLVWNERMKRFTYPHTAAFLVVLLTVCWFSPLPFTVFPNPNIRGQHYSLVQPHTGLWKKTPYGLLCYLSERLFQDTSLAPGTGRAVSGRVYLVGISGFPSHPSYGRPRILATSQADLFRGKLILLQKANAKINPRLSESREVSGRRSLCKSVLLFPCWNQPPLASTTSAQCWAVPSRRKCTGRG